MNILSFKVKNFRSFEGTDIETKVVLRKGINTIVGENNVGKSSLFRALEILSGKISAVKEDFYKGERTRALFFEIEVELSNDEFKLFAKALTKNGKHLENSENIERFAKDFGNKISLTFSSTKGYEVRTPFFRFERNVAYPIIEHKPQRIMVMNESDFLPSYFSQELSLIPFMRSRGGAVNNPIAISFPTEPENFVKSLLLEKTKIISEIRKRPVGENTRLLESLDGGLVADVLSTLKNGNKEERAKFELIKLEFSRLFPNLKLEVTGGPNIVPAIVIDKISIDYEVPIANIGAGIGEMIILLTHLIKSKDLIFGLDLPEMQFHPHAQRLLLKVLEEHAKNNQILIVTHSPMLLNPKKLENIVIIRERNGSSFSSQLPDNYFTGKEKVKLERLLIDNSKDFFFSRATLIVEGPTETGAMPVFSETLDVDFDTQGISMVKMEGNYFGLWDKLLSGFGIPHVVMCDKDALMNIGGNIECEKAKIKTSQVFCSLSDANHLTEEDGKKIAAVQSQIIKVGDKETYPDSLFEELKAVAEKHNDYILSSDFEGVLKEKGFGDALKEAGSISRSKVIQGRFVAEKILEKSKGVPPEFATVINAVQELATPVEKSS